jgi:hypothetical protein
MGAGVIAARSLPVSRAEPKVQLHSCALDEDQQFPGCREIAARARRSGSLRPRPRGNASACTSNEPRRRCPSRCSARPLPDKGSHEGGTTFHTRASTKAGPGPCVPRHLLVARCTSAGSASHGPLGCKHRRGKRQSLPWRVGLVLVVPSDRVSAIAGADTPPWPECTTPPRHPGLAVALARIRSVARADAESDSLESSDAPALVAAARDRPGRKRARDSADRVNAGTAR